MEASQKSLLLPENRYGEEVQSLVQIPLISNGGDGIHTQQCQLLTITPAGTLDTRVIPRNSEIRRAGAGRQALRVFKDPSDSDVQRGWEIAAHPVLLHLVPAVTALDG